jgi:hypothetical protein
VIDPAFKKTLDRSTDRLQANDTAVIAGMRFYMRF